MNTLTEKKRFDSSETLIVSIQAAYWFGKSIA